MNSNHKDNNFSELSTAERISSKNTFFLKYFFPLIINIPAIFYTTITIILMGFQFWHPFLFLLIGLTLYVLKNLIILKSLKLSSNYLYIKNYRKYIAVNLTDIKNIEQISYSLEFIKISFKYKTKFGKSIIFSPPYRGLGPLNKEEHPIIKRITSYSLFNKTDESYKRTYKIMLNISVILLLLIGIYSVIIKIIGEMILQITFISIFLLNFSSLILYYKKYRNNFFFTLILSLVFIITLIVPNYINMLNLRKDTSQNFHNIMNDKIIEIHIYFHSFSESSFYVIIKNKYIINEIHKSLFEMTPISRCNSRRYDNYVVTLISKNHKSTFIYRKTLADPDCIYTHPGLEPDSHLNDPICNSLTLFENSDHDALSYNYFPVEQNVGFERYINTKFAKILSKYVDRYIRNTKPNEIYIIK